MPEPRLLVVTGLWPTPDRPHAGVFVRDRVAGMRGPVVVGPDRYDQPMPLRYLRIARQALTTRGRFDGVEAHVLFPAGLIGLVAARIRRVPLVTYAHGADVRETAVQNSVYRFLARLVVRGSAAVVTNSDDSAALVARLGGSARVIPPGVDLSRFRPTARPPRRVLYLGGTDPRKGYTVACDLADTLVGPGLSVIAPEDIPALIAAHDILLVPSRAEPYGLVAAEAIASGRWVVARRVGGLPSIVEDGVTGTLVDSDDDFGSAIAAVPDYDPEAISAHAEGFSLKRANDAMADLWSEVRSGPA